MYDIDQIEATLMKPIISRLRHTVVALLFALSISAANAQISYTATFDQHLLTTDTVSENGDSYLRLRYPDLWTQSARAACTLFAIFRSLRCYRFHGFRYGRDHNCDSVYATGLSDPAAYSLRQEYKRATVRFPRQHGI